MDCPRATERLKIGLPSTIAHATSTAPLTSYGSTSGPGIRSPAGASPQLYVAATEAFITFLDALKLGLGSKAELHPLLTDVIQTANSVTGGLDFEGRASIVKWLIRLNGMRVQETLPEGEVSELAFEMAGAYEGFKGCLK